MTRYPYPYPVGTSKATRTASATTQAAFFFNLSQIIGQYHRFPLLYSS